MKLCELKHWMKLIQFLLLSSFFKNMLDRGAFWAYFNLNTRTVSSKVLWKVLDYFVIIC